MEKDEISKGLEETGLAGSCQIMVNDAGTVDQNDTRLTQRRSLPVRTRARGYIYFIKVGDAIKIGYSTRPIDRLKTLQTSNPGKLEILGTRWSSREFEKELHIHFKRLHIRGEWFHAKISLLRYIEGHTPEGVARAADRRNDHLNSLGPAGAAA